MLVAMSVVAVVAVGVLGWFLGADWKEREFRRKLVDRYRMLVIADGEGSRKYDPGRVAELDHIRQMLDLGGTPQGS